MKKRISLLMFAFCLTASFAQAEPKSETTVQNQEEKGIATDAPQELWIKNGTRNIYGQLSRPEKAQAKSPIAIIAHGFNGTHHAGLKYFDMLNSMGFLCYTFDFPCGSPQSKSDANTMEMSILDEQSDLEAIVRYFKSRPDVDASRIVLIGGSQGGLVSALTAANLPEEVSELVLIYPALCIPDNWRKSYPQVENIPDTTRLWNVPMGRRFFAEIHDMDAFELIGKYQKPVIIIQGDADRIVSLEDSRRAIKLYKDARLHVIPGAGHGFRPHEFKESLEQIKLFLNGERRISK